MARRQFPLDNAFSLLQAEVEKTQAAFEKLRAGLSAAAPTAGGAAGAAAATAANTKSISDTLKVRDALSSIKDLQDGLKAGGTIAKHLGFEDASRKAEVAAQRVELFGNALKGVVATGKLLGAIWKPAIAGIAVASAALIGLNKIIESTTGLSLTLRETIEGIGLGFVAGLQKAKVAFLQFKALASTGRPLSVFLDKDVRAANIELEATQQTLQDIVKKVEGRPSPQFSSFVDELKTKFGDLGQEISKALDPIFGFGGTQERGKPEKAQLDRFRDLGNDGGVAYASGVEEAVASFKLDQAIVDALIVDPDDQTKVINSVNDLLKNIKKLFEENPIGFVFGALGMGGAGGQQVQGFADGGMVDGAPAPFPRPAGLHPTDTVPAFLAQGEYVQRVGAVRHYGAQVMEALNSIRIPREPLLALAAGIRVPQTVRAPAPRGYAAGGMVGPVSGSGPGAAPAVTVAPVLVADGPSFGRMLAAGDNEMRRWLRDRGYGQGRA